MRKVDLVNKRFGKLVVIKQDEKIVPGRVNKNPYWLCKCDCGKITSVASPGLKNGTRSCGCLNKGRMSTHGKSRTLEYRIWNSTKSRAKKEGIPFNLSLEDIIIPEKCPILGIPIKVGTGYGRSNSPSLDRFYPNIGYVKGNISIISNKANTIKNASSFEEFEKVYFWYKSEIDKRNTSCR